MDILATEHEQVVFRQDRRTGLKAFIAIHDTRLGPATGGCRHWTYRSESEALTDALRLSQGMTLKNALADIPFGGGKSVILGRFGERLTEAQLEQFGRWIEELGGRYITAEDVGMRVADMRIVAGQTAYVSGLGRNGIGGDPSPFTAEGVYLGMAAAIRIRLGAESLEGVRVAVQGLGSVGYQLCLRLHRAGARLIVADLDPDLVDRAVAEFGAAAVAPDEILNQEVDVFAPCALGGVLTDDSVRRLKASVVAGSANNQLQTAAVAARLAEKDVLYAPDYVVNAGGVISVAAEYLGSVGEGWIRQRIEGIPLRLERIFDEAVALGDTTDQVARKMADAALDRGRPEHVEALPQTG